MKTKQILMVLGFVVALFMVVSTLNISSAKSINGKKTPGAMATQNAINHAAGVTGNPHGKPANFQGIISAIDSSSIALTLRDGTSVTIALTADTKIRIPKGKSAGINGLVPGMKVMVHATRNQDDSFTARSIGLIPKSANESEDSTE